MGVDGGAFAAVFIWISLRGFWRWVGLHLPSLLGPGFRRFRRVGAGFAGCNWFFWYLYLFIVDFISDIVLSFEFVYTLLLNSVLFSGVIVS